MRKASNGAIGKRNRLTKNRFLEMTERDLYFSVSEPQQGNDKHDGQHQLKDDQYTVCEVHLAQQSLIDSNLLTMLV